MVAPLAVEGAGAVPSSVGGKAPSGMGPPIGASTASSPLTGPSSMAPIVLSSMGGDAAPVENATGALAGAWADAKPRMATSTRARTTS